MTELVKIQCYVTDEIVDRIKTGHLGYHLILDNFPTIEEGEEKP